MNKRKLLGVLAGTVVAFLCGCGPDLAASAAATAKLQAEQARQGQLQTDGVRQKLDEAMNAAANAASAAADR